MSLVPGSFSVPTSATKLPISAPGPGSLVLINTGPNAITIGGVGVTAGAVGVGSATIPANGVVSLPLAGGVQSGQFYGVAATGASVLNWFYSTSGVSS